MKDSREQKWFRIWSMIAPAFSALIIAIMRMLLSFWDWGRATAASADG
jgi:hypothetical protein